MADRVDLIGSAFSDTGLTSLEPEIGGVAECELDLHWFNDGKGGSSRFRLTETFDFCCSGEPSSLVAARPRPSLFELELPGLLTSGLLSLFLPRWNVLNALNLLVVVVSEGATCETVLRKESIDRPLLSDRPPRSTLGLRLVVLGRK